jgi:hypothetical protein
MIARFHRGCSRSSSSAAMWSRPHRRQHIVFGRWRLKLIVRRDEQDREARRVGGRTCFGRSLVMFTFRLGIRTQGLIMTFCS